MSTLFGSSYHDSIIAAREETQRNAGEAPRLRRENEGMADAIRHVLRYGKLGKQSEARLRAALPRFHAGDTVSPPSNSQQTRKAQR